MEQIVFKKLILENSLIVALYIMRVKEQKLFKTPGLKNLKTTLEKKELM